MSDEPRIDAYLPGEFLTATWGTGPHSLCWMAPGGAFGFVFVVSPDEATQQAASHADADVWISAHPLKGKPLRGRGGRDDVAEVGAIPADLDWAHWTRRTDDTLPTEAEVRERLAKLGPDLQPNVVVNSGHGLQVWWLLTRAVTPDEAEALIARIDAKLAEVDLENGRSDLPSILRLPGTRNHKGDGEPVPVVIEQMDTQHRYTPERLRKHLPEPAAGHRAGGGTKHHRGAITDDQQALVNLVVATYGGHSPDVWRDGSIHLVRPGKEAREGSSASIIVGDEGDALLTVFTDHWPDLKPGSYVLGIDGKLHHPSDPLARVTINTGGPATTGQGGQEAEPRRLLTWKQAPDPFVVPRIEWLVEGLWCQGTHGELAGQEKTLKSTLSTIIDVGLAAGVPVLGQFPVDQPKRVLHLAGEGGEVGYWSRLGRVCAAYGVSVAQVRENLLTTFGTASMSNPTLVSEVEQQLECFGPALTHLDPYYAYSPTGVDSRQLNDVGAALNAFGSLCARHGSTLLINNHFNQTGSGNGLTRITGAGHAEWVDSWLLVSHRQTADVPRGRFWLRLEVGSRQWGGTSWEVDLDLGRYDPATGLHMGAVKWSIRPATAPTPDPQTAHDAKIAQARVDLLRVGRRKRKPFTKSDLVNDTAGSKTFKLRAFDQLVDTSHIVQVGTRSVPWGKGTRAVPEFEVPNTP